MDDASRRALRPITCRTPSAIGLSTALQQLSKEVCAVAKRELGQWSVASRGLSHELSSNDILIQCPSEDTER